VKPGSRRIFSGIALAAGLALVFFELRRALAVGRVESWFWLTVGVLVILLAAAEFLPMARHDDDDVSPGGDKVR
jgi:hypothetical protein